MPFNYLNFYNNKLQFSCGCSQSDISEMLNPSEDYPIDWGVDGPNLNLNSNLSATNSVWQNSMSQNSFDMPTMFNIPSGNIHINNNDQALLQNEGFVKWLQNKFNIGGVNSTQRSAAPQVNNVMAESLKQQCGYSQNKGNAIANSALDVVNKGGLPSHWCYRGVKNALKPFGVSFPKKSTKAYQAAGILEQYPDKFKEITISRDKLRKLPAGTVVVYDKVKNYQGSSSACKYGHVSIALGDGREASDVLRNKQILSYIDRSHGKTYYPSFRVFIPTEG